MQAARSHGTTPEELRAAFCSEEPRERAWAYETIGGHHGYVNLDGYLTESELNERFGRKEAGDTQEEDSEAV